MDQNQKQAPEDQQEIEESKENFFDGDDLDGEEEFEFVNTGGQNKEDDEFDEIVGALQDLVMDPEFEEQQREFLEKNCDVFEDMDENKLEYTKIFQEYQDKLENYMEKKLKESKPDLDMAKFILMVEQRIDEIDPQLQDMLLTFTDFQLFKEHMLAHKKLQLSIKKKSKKFEEFKQSKSNQLTALEQDLGDLIISGQSKKFHVEKGKPGAKVPDVKSLKKDIPGSKDTKKKEEPKKPAEDFDAAKFTHKKTSTKADPQHKSQTKGSIFS